MIGHEAGVLGGGEWKRQREGTAWAKAEQRKDALKTVRLWNNCNMRFAWGTSWEGNFENRSWRA